MPLNMPIRDLRNTTEISNIEHQEQEIADGADAVDVERIFADLALKKPKSLDFSKNFGFHNQRALEDSNPRPFGP